MFTINAINANRRQINKVFSLAIRGPTLVSRNIPLKHVVVQSQLLNQPVISSVVCPQTANGMNPEESAASSPAVEEGDESNPLNVIHDE